MKGLTLVLLSLTARLQADPGDLDGLLADLGNPRFATRQNASEKMAAIFSGKEKRETSLLRIRKLWRQETHPEIRARLFQLGRGLFAQTEGSLFGFRFMMARALKVNGKTTSSVIIKEVIPNTPADQAGLLANDLIYGANDTLLGRGRSADDALVFFKFLEPATTHRLLVERNGKRLVLEVRPNTQNLTTGEKQLIRKGYLQWLLSSQPANQRAFKSDLSGAAPAQK